MPTPSRQRIVATLLHRHPRTFAEELGIDLGSGEPDALFCWLCAALLFSARISANAAMRAAAALFEHGWTDPRALTAATWEERTRVLNRSGYARYDESTSRMLATSATLLLERYNGDLWRLREQAGREPDRERELLKEFKGIGEVGVDIFFREVQAVWEELMPFADRRALNAARALALGADARALGKLVEPQDYTRLIAALVRTDLHHDAEAVLAEARGPSAQ